MTFEAVQGVIRHILTFGGGFLVTNGMVDESAMQAGVGALVTLIGIAWSIWQKKQAAE